VEKEEKQISTEGILTLAPKNNEVQVDHGFLFVVGGVGLF